KTKFWQMVGRGTRLCKDLFGPSVDKQFFYLFDYCQNLEFFSQDTPTTEGALGASLGKRLFTARLELIAELDRMQDVGAGGRLVLGEGFSADRPPHSEIELRHSASKFLHDEVTAMNLDNFIVRPKRRL